jgi:hypothetical protein
MNVPGVYKFYFDRFSTYSNEHIEFLLGCEKANKGWTRTRAIYLAALKHIARSRDII